MSVQLIGYKRYGNPFEVLNLEEKEAEVLQEQMVRVKLLASTIQPSDMGKIQGTYGRLAPLPAIGGREGIGEISEIGSGVKHLKVGMRVRIPEDLGVWQSEVVVPAENLIVVPQSLPVEDAVQSFINPTTAWRLLTDFVPLRPNDWVIQNAATSCVGRCVIQLAKHWGYKTINVVRDLAVMSELEKLGADVVCTLDDLKNVKDLTHGEQPKLGLNSVGGEYALKLIKSLDTHATLVTFGGMVGEKVRFPTRELIFRDIQLRGFWMDAWMRTHSPLEVRTCLQNIWNLMQRKELVLPKTVSFPLNQWRQAIEMATEQSQKKVLLVP